MGWSDELSLHFSQRSVRDWREGEISALEAKVMSTITSRITFDALTIASQINCSIGVQSLDISDTLPPLVLPTANDLRVECTVRYRLGWLLDPTFTFTATTQVTESFRLQGLQRIRTAKFGDPISTHQSFGLGYAPPSIIV
ncbi:MAG: hypothetical protein N2971_08365 [Chlorobi bacterium]|nr:hypothetical protein [Chlorobiota bacterium]